MKPITLHPSSLLAGAAFTLFAVVAMGQKTVPTSTSTNELPPAGEYGAELVRQPKFAVHPRDWVQVEEGVPYTVPAGKILVITAIGSFFSLDARANVLLDGEQQLAASPHTNYGNGATMKLIPRGLSAPEGVLVEVEGGDSGQLDARAWGYLVDE